MRELIDRQALLDSVYKNLPMIPSMSGMTAEEMRLRIAALIENAPTASPWHRVEEKPAKEEECLTVSVDGHIEVNWWSNSWGWLHDADNIEWWMPLPEPPKEESNA